MRKRVAAAVLGSLLPFLSPTQARAERKPTSTTTGYSPYEKETIARSLKATGAELDLAPEGKTIEVIDTLRLEVLEDRDPIPIGRKFLNSLHVTSRDRVIRREVLLREGDSYEQVTIDETARNMRNRIPQVSIVIIVPVRGSGPDKVKLLVITKDVWSLRLSYDLSLTPGGMEKLLIVPQETNLFGVHHIASTNFLYQPLSYTLGLGYRVPRFGLSWIGASATASMTINRLSQKPEGSAMSISVGQGLYSTRTEWAWSANANYDVGFVRRYVNAHLGRFNSPVTKGVEDNIPTEYKNSTKKVSFGVTRSFGWAVKNNFNLSMNATDSECSYATAGFDPRALADFEERFVPRCEARVYPSLSWATFSNDFLRTLDVDTLALQEDYRLGHEITASIYPVIGALGSKRDLVGMSGKASYALALGDGLAAASVAGVAEDASGEVTDATFSGSLGAVTPRLGFGRLVMNASFINRYRNYMRGKTILGGDGRLRGYPSNFFFGRDAVFYNIEFRTTSVEIVKLAFGAVAFFDAGDVAQGFQALHAKQSVGVGLRTLIPQLNRYVFRIDVAFPMKRGPFPEQGISTPVDPVGFFASFEQAFTP